MADTPRDKSPKSNASRKRKIAFRLGAIGVAFLPFVILELTLRVMGVGRPTSVDDPFVGFSNVYPQFERDAQGEKYVTSLPRRKFFGTQEFAVRKPANGFRAFCLGGSTVRGRPYTTETAFARWMQVELSTGDAKTQYEIVNCGGLSYASYRLRPMLAEVLKYEPDVIVIATGHNEFLEDRTYQSVKEQSAARRWISERLFSLHTVNLVRRWVGTGKQKLPDDFDTRLDDSKNGYESYHRDDEWRKNVIRHFEHSLRAMITMCREKNVPVVLVRLGANLRDCPPFKSELSEKLSDEQRQSWQQHFDVATRAEKSNLEQAVAEYHKAEAIDADHALLYYRIARCYDRLGDYEKARTYYRRAKNRDVCPLRILDEMADKVAAVAKETKTPLVDAKSLFERQSPQNIPGSDFYMDHVHPTIGGHQQIAHALVEMLAQQGTLPKSFHPCTAAERRAAYRRHFRELNLANHLAGGAERLRWLEGWAQRHRLQAETVPVDARGRLYKGHRHLDLGETAAAWREYGRALNDSQTMAVDELLRHALSLFQQGRPNQAAMILAELRRFTTSEQRDRLDVGRLIVALELDDAQTVRELMSMNAAHLAAAAQGTGWLRVMPDVLERAKQRVERDKR